jgi:UPF0755 protein
VVVIISSLSRSSAWSRRRRAYKLQFGRAGSLDQPRSVVIADGSSAATVAELLQRHGIISNGWVFRAGVRLSGQGHNLKAGEYLIPAHASMQSIMDAMVAGKSILYSVTLPEGLTSQQIVDRLRGDETLAGDITDVPPEGSLLPDTYKFTRGDTRQNIVNRMRRERDRVLTEVWSRRVEGLPVSTPEELVILASIVEKETAISDERSRVASVFINRLNRRMRLQSDPTAIYGIFGGKGKPADRAVTRTDLDQLSTTHLPDQRAAGADRQSAAPLEAVANPHAADLYFVADGTGGCLRRSYDDHRRNVALADLRSNAGERDRCHGGSLTAAGPGVLDGPTIPTLKRTAAAAPAGKPDVVKPAAAPASP